LPPEPSPLRTVVFVDGQNVDALARRLCLRQGWRLEQVRFYTGIPEPADNRFWSRFWSAKLGAMGHQGVYVFTRPLRYRAKIVSLPDGSQHSIVSAEEKGIDVRIALDIVRMSYRGEYDVALILSQDQDLSEVALEIRKAPPGLGSRPTCTVRPR